MSAPTAIRILFTSAMTVLSLWCVVAATCADGTEPLERHRQRSRRGIVIAALRASATPP